MICAAEEEVVIEVVDLDRDGMLDRVGFLPRSSSSVGNVFQNGSEDLIFAVDEDNFAADADLRFSSALFLM